MFNQIQNNYDRLSGWYDLIEGWGEKSICVNAIKLINVQSGEKVLEVGSGTGSNLLRISQAVEKCEIAGLDLSYKMCQQAKMKAGRKKDSSVEFVNSNAIQLPFPENQFDVLFMLFTFEIIPDEYLSLAMSECRRVLKPSGRLCIGAISAEKMNRLMMRLYLWSIHHYPGIVDCRPIDLDSILKNAGFESMVNQFHSLWGLPVRILLATKSSRSKDEAANFSN
jgi:ubiquinone/menaquinone biosynthesis C-methylase UbiE